MVRNLLVALASMAFLSTVHGQVDTQKDSERDFDPNWNYDEGGDDWNFANCNNAK